MTQFDSEEFLNNLQANIERSADRLGFSCPICEASEWTIVDGTVQMPVSGEGVGDIQAVPVVCENCGFIASFAVGQENTE